MKKEKSKKKGQGHRGRPKGSKNKKTLDKDKKSFQNKQKEDLETNIKTKEFKPIKLKKPIELKLNDIYKKNRKFFLIGKYSGFISRWKPGQEKIIFNERDNIILDKFPEEEEYYNLFMKG